MPAIDMETWGNPKVSQKNIRAFALKLGTAALFANLVVLCLVVFILTQTRQERVQRANVSSQNISRILEHDVSSVFDKMSFVLFALADEAEHFDFSPRDDAVLGFSGQQAGDVFANGLAAGVDLANRLDKFSAADIFRDIAAGTSLQRMTDVLVRLGGC